MRLTLRTLLAHLDKTLEADDDASIAAKLQESEFASNLVRRISACISSDQLSAPSPVSTSTADDANRIGEYLDSVLSAEQVAEIERICLESDGHLAEVAACHQILTIVLGNPADIPTALRNRIVELGQLRDHALPSANGEQTDPAHLTALPRVPASSHDAITQAIAADAGVVPFSAPPPVAPVGPDDSGVSNAPTRLREAAQATARPISREPAMAGSRPINVAEASEIFGRPSRVVPWLVSLALIAAFLLVAVQAFSPLLRKGVTLDDDRIAQADSAAVPASDDAPVGTASGERTASDVEVQADSAPPMVDLDPSPPPAAADVDLTESSPAAAPSTESDLPLPKPVPKETPPVATVTSPVEEKATTPADAPVAKTPERATEDAPPRAADVMPPATATAAAAVLTPAAVPTPAAADSAAPDSAMPATPDRTAEMEAPLPATETPAPIESSMIPGTTLLSEGSLFLVRTPDNPSHFLVKQNDPIPNGSELVCPPLYRDRVSLMGALDMTMVGPTKLTVASTGDDQAATLRLASGRILISPPMVTPPPPTDDNLDSVPTDTADRMVHIDFGGTVHDLNLEDADSRAALEVYYLRSPGADPEEPQSSAPVIEVLAVHGTLVWTAGDQTVRLDTGEMLRWSPPAESTKIIPTSVPAWIDAPVLAPGAIESSARDGLLTLVRANESIEMSLREAISFRRAEVGALAAQTLALLERPSVYFGTDGVFSDVKQKAFWPDHFKTLVTMIDRGPESAAVIREAINQMDAAEATAIYRLLWLFSNAQLEAGSDELLVASLDHANMTVRVLAAENLRQITGTTLFFKPENETAPRRSSDIKKWETRLRKGDIRWPAT